MRSVATMTAALGLGMRRHRVERTFGDHKSWGYAGGAGGYQRSYKTCDHPHAAIIEYQVIWKKRKVVGARFDGHKRWIPAG